jgi:hypothetical protein
MTNEQFTKIGDKAVVWGVGAAVWVSMLGGSHLLSLIGAICSVTYLVYSEVQEIKKKKRANKDGSIQ